MGKELLSNIGIIKESGAMSCEDLLTLMGNTAIEKGWAKEGYVEALLKREAEFATGLHASVDIAIPHADPVWTKEPAILVGFLDKPVSFQSMGGQGGAVPAQLVFMLVIKDNNSHIDFLQAMSEFISGGDHLKELYEKQDISCLISYLDENM